MEETTLAFVKVLEHEALVSDVSFKCIKNAFSCEEQNNIFVAHIDTDYIDGINLCEHYNVNTKNGVNCLVVECKRGDNKQYVALLVPVGYKYDMSSTVRKYTNSRMVSVAPLDFVLENTKMEYGSINPIGLPQDWKIFIDPKILEVEKIICGSGKRISKLCLPSKYLLKLPNVEILSNLAKDINYNN